MAFLCGVNVACVTGANLAVNAGVHVHQRVCTPTAPQGYDERLSLASTSMRSTCEKASRSATYGSSLEVLLETCV